MISIMNVRIKACKVNLDSRAAALQESWWMA